MNNSIIIVIISIVFFALFVGLMTLLVKALIKYIKSHDVSRK